MTPGGTRYLLISILSTGLLVYFWIGVDEPLNPKHISLNSQNVVLALEDTLVAHYAKKLEDNYQAPQTPVEKMQEVRVVLQNFQQRLATLKNKSPDDNVLKVISSISSPVIQGNKLQASAIELKELLSSAPNKETLVFIGYNMIGPKNLGAVQIISLKEVKGKGKKASSSLEVTLLQTALLNDCEVHDLKVVEDETGAKLMIAGQVNDESFKTPSFLEILSLDDGIIEDISSVRIDLPSYAATSVLSAHGKVFVSVGDDQGGIVQLNNLSNVNPGKHHYSEIEHEFYELQDARDLAANNHSIYAVSGGQATLWSKRLKGEGSRGSLPVTSVLEGGLIPEAKSSIDVTQNLAYLGLGDGGTQIISLNHLSKAGEVPQMVLEELDSTLTVTNSVYVNDKELFTADGEAGSRLFYLTSPTTLEQVAHIKFGPKTSVNAINKVGDYVVFAVGLGGVKIARHFK